MVMVEILYNSSMVEGVFFGVKIQVMHMLY